MTGDENRKDRMFQRLAYLVKERYGAVITFTDLNARLRIADVKTVTAVQRNPHAEFIVSGNDLVLPIRGNENLLGYITLFDGIKLNEAAISQIRQVTDLLLTETLILEDKAQRMKVVEHFIQSFESIDQVVDLKDRMQTEEINYLNPEISISEHHLENLFPVLVESHSVGEAKELALELHRSTDRNSFLTLEDYLLENFSSPEKIKTLGPITLFIPSVNTLSQAAQNNILSYLKNSNYTSTGPRIIGAVQSSPESLVANGTLVSELREALASARIKLPPKGTSSMSLDEIMGFFESATPNNKSSNSNRTRHLHLVNPEEYSH